MSVRPIRSRPSILFTIASAVVLSGSCSNTLPLALNPDMTDGTSLGVDLTKFVVNCAGQASDTIVTGVVTAPNGLDPIRQAQIYVPRDGTVYPFSQKVSCDVCGDPVSGVPVTQTISGIDGSFTLRGVPVTADTPIVIQKGHWRRVVHLPVKSCQSQALTTDQARLPKNHTEGDLPKMAVAVGNYDAIECVLRSIGVEDSEFTAPTGTGMVHLYDNEDSGTGAPGKVNIGDLVTNLDQMNSYNLIFINCSNTTYAQALLQNQTVLYNLTSYVNGGGRLYTTDWSYDWIEQPASFAPYICFDDGTSCNILAPHGYQAAVGNAGDPTPFTATASQTTTPGQALSGWLNVLPQPVPNGKVPIMDLLPAWVAMRQTATNQQTYPSTTWLSGPVQGNTWPLTVSFDYPVQPQACGKVLYSSYHTRNHSGNVLFPGYCAAGAMIPQEHVLEFLIFEISSCVGTLG